MMKRKTCSFCDNKKFVTFPVGKHGELLLTVDESTEVVGYDHVACPVCQTSMWQAA